MFAMKTQEIRKSVSNDQKQRAGASTTGRRVSDTLEFDKRRRKSMNIMIFCFL
jgi:hypothetical protein